MFVSLLSETLLQNERSFTLEQNAVSPDQTKARSRVRGFTQAGRFTETPPKYPESRAKKIF